MKNLNFIYLMLLVINFGDVLLENLPDFIKPCRQNDININQCFINNSIVAIPELIKGVDYLKIPVLSPLFLKKIELVNTDNLKLTFYNLTAKGLETAKTLDANVDFKNKSIEVKIHFDKMLFEGTYFIEGHILILPISGSGTAKINFDDVIIRFYTDYELKLKNGTEFMHFIHSKISYDLSHASYYLKDLFNGDEFLGKQTNKFLNENWQDLHEEFSPTIGESIKKTVLKIIDGIVNVIPFNEVFIP